MLIVEIVFGATVALQKKKHDRERERETEVRVTRQAVIALDRIARTPTRQNLCLLNMGALETLR